MDAEAGNADSRDSQAKCFDSSIIFFLRPLFSGFWRSIDRHRQRWRLTVTAFAHFWLIRQRAAPAGSADEPTIQPLMQIVYYSVKNAAYKWSTRSLTAFAENVVDSFSHMYSNHEHEHEH